MVQWGADKHLFSPYLCDHLLAAARHGRRYWAAEGPPLCWALCVQIIPKWVGLLTDGKVV